MARRSRAAGSGEPQGPHDLVYRPRSHAPHRAARVLIERQAIDDHGRVGEIGIDRSLHRTDRLDRQPQALGRQKHRQRIDALPHLLMRHGDFDLAVARKFQPGTEAGLALARRQLVAIDAVQPREHRAYSDDEAAAHDTGPDQEGAPCNSPGT